MLTRDIKNPIVLELATLADKLTWEAAGEDKSVTVISGGGSTFVERGFSGCGSVWFGISKKDWKLAKRLGFKKGYQSWDGPWEYYNGQHGVASGAWNRALRELKLKYPGNEILEKIYVGTWVD